VRARLKLDYIPRFHECWEEIFRILAKYPSLRKDLENAINAKTETHSIQRTLQWLKAFENRYLKINTAFLTVESHDIALCDAADTLASRTQRAFQEEIGQLKHQQQRSANYRQHAGVALVKTICKGMEVNPPNIPEPEKLDQMSVVSAVARLVDPKWWRRKARTLQARKLEAASRYLGAVCKRRGGYCSDASLRRHTAQKHRNRELLEKLEAINDQGQRYTLAELSDLGVSNPVIRRSELMTRIRGTDEYAQYITDYVQDVRYAGFAGAKTGYVPVFITHTCPSAFHSHNRSGSEYDKWNRTTPREAQQYLSSIWAKVRSNWQRENIPSFGFRVAEPHHDGCPHWHLLLWFPKDKTDQALTIYRSYALADFPNELGAQERRFTAKRDELARGATNYIAKYISKNVDGLNADGEAWSLDVVKTAVRTEAWARTWGIRQFQSIGLPSVTVYRECRRLSDEQITEQLQHMPDADIKNTIRAIRDAANKGDWCAYIKAMGGVAIPRDQQPLRAYMLIKLKETGEAALNQYGETVEQLKGILAWNAVPVITRIYEWVIQPIKTNEDESFYQEAHAPPLDLCQ